MGEILDYAKPFGDKHLHQGNPAPRDVNLWYVRGYNYFIYFGLFWPYLLKWACISQTIRLKYSMRNEKKTKKDSRIHPENDDNIYRDNEKKTTKKQLDPYCNSEQIMVESSITIEKLTCAPHTRSLPARRTKAERRNMQTTKNNTLTKKGEKIMCDFDNGIFRTIPHDTIDGVVWLTRVADGERITFCRTQEDVMFCVAELMKQRLGL